MLKTALVMAIVLVLAQRSLFISAAARPILRYGALAALIEALTAFRVAPTHEMLRGARTVSRVSPSYRSRLNGVSAFESMARAPRSLSSRSEAARRC